MDSERWQNVERLYHATLECEESQRAAFLVRVCGGDLALRREVESLVSYGKRSGKFIEGSALELVAPALAGEGDDRQDPAPDERRMIGKRISQYCVVEQLGSGGMGEVYRAVRADDQYQKQVAIKLVRAGEDSGLVIGRFKKERQILAGLDHPNIARLHDGGATGEGVPYFVMELVEGQPIDKYCDSHKLGIPARLKLFLQVCSALRYAHQHQIIHRDVKPANILVTAEGVPKLLDFGIAKILASDVWDGAAVVVGQTQTMFRAFTPEYASPEQIKVEPISTASDVYSLGVLLYELLTGHRPHRFKTRTPLEIERAVCEEEPLNPSTVVTRVEVQTMADGTTASITPEEISSARDSDPKQMHRCLLGDLDAIAMMALRKEPHRRYASVDDLSEDIRKHLEGLPIAARPSTLAYRAAKFVRRQWESAAGVLVLLGGLAIVLTAGLRVFVHQSSPSIDTQSISIRKLTDHGQVAANSGAAISADGKWFAYIRFEGERTLQVKQIATENEITAVHALPAGFYGIALSPDGNRVYYTRSNDSYLSKGTAYMVPALGGPSRQVASNVIGPVAVSPRGEHIAYWRIHDSGDDQIVVANEDGSDEHVILARKGFKAGGSGFSAAPTWSAAGNLLCVEALDKIDNSILLFTPEGNLVKKFPVREDLDILTTAFLSDSSGVLFLGGERATGFRRQIWFQPYSGGEPIRVTNDLDDYVSLSVSGDGSSFVSNQTHKESTVYVANSPSVLDEKTAWKFRPVSIEQAPGYRLSWTQGGKLLQEDYFLQTWVSAADGTARVRILDNGDTFEPMGCGPGDTVVLARLSEDMEWHLWRLNLATREWKQLTYGVSQWNSDCTPDGKWLVYVDRSSNDGVRRLFKLPIEGGTPFELGRGKIPSLKVSPDGGSLAYFRIDGRDPSSKRTFLVQELQGGSPPKEIESTRDSDYIGWTPDGRALTFLHTEGSSRSLYMQPVSGGKPVRLLHFDEEPSSITAYRWSVDGKKVAITRSRSRDTDVVMFSRVRPAKTPDSVLH